MKYMLTTDTHFNHTKIKEYCERPDNYEDLIINGISWRSDVPDEVKKICIEVISKYEKEFKKESL